MAIFLQYSIFHCDKQVSGIPISEQAGQLNKYLEYSMLIQLEPGPGWIQVESIQRKLWIPAESDVSSSWAFRLNHILTFAGFYLGFIWV
jgi:hypothetical protein